VGEEWPDELMVQQSEDEQVQPESLLQPYNRLQDAGKADHE
jgi:hypothetical protein